MKLARACGLLALAVLLATVGGRQASAQTMGMYGCSGFAQPAWLAYAHSPYAMGQIPVPPYFAIHPPVYYSAPVPRSYGYSPYAYPGTMETPAIVMPEMIENPHVVPQSGPAKTSSAKIVQAQVIENPYVQSRLATAKK